MNKKPDLFVNKIDKTINNNERVYCSNNQNNRKIKENIKNNKKTKNINQKINAIFMSTNYVYKAQVKLTFKDKEEVRKIVGKNQKYLITMDNELIPIADILDIEIAQ